MGDNEKLEKRAADAEDKQGTACHRQLFELTFHKLAREERIALARDCSGPALSAFCFDPDPGVILNGVLENLHTGIDHARLIAANHRSTQGLQGLADRSQLLADAQVQRHLLRNAQTGEAVLRRLLSNKPLQLLFQVLMGREITERARLVSTQVFKQRFQTAGPDEKVGVIINSEGRCLRFLVGCPLDGRAATIICGRNAMSSFLIQNLARWPTAPPQVLRHLARQSTVRQNAGIKQLILRNPNCPSDLKRGRI